MGGTGHEPETPACQAGRLGAHEADAGRVHIVPIRMQELLMVACQARYRITPLKETFTLPVVLSKTASE